MVQVSFVCAPVAAVASLSPPSQSARPGAALSYTLSLKNNDLPSCRSTTFALTPAVPAGWTGTVTPGSLNLLPGEAGSAILAVTSPANAASTGYTVGVDSADGVELTHNSSASAVHLVDGIPPAAPSNLRPAVRRRRIQLSWTASTDNMGVAGYSVWRNNTLLATTTSTSTSYQDLAVTVGATYTYFVTARDSAGNISAPSSTVTVKAK